MSQQTGAHATIAAASVILVIGLVTVAAAALQYWPHALAVAGTCMVMVAITTMSMSLLRAWVTDTSRERQQHLDAAAAAEGERARYQAETERIRSEAKFETARVAQDLAARQEALRLHFEAQRATLITEAFEAGARMALAGQLDAPPPAEVIRFPAPAPAHAQSPAQEMARERAADRPL